MTAWALLGSFVGLLGALGTEDLLVSKVILSQGHLQSSHSPADTSLGNRVIIRVSHEIWELDFTVYPKPE